MANRWRKRKRKLHFHFLSYKIFIFDKGTNIDEIVRAIVNPNFTEEIIKSIIGDLITDGPNR
jgi:hypothetical protein